MLHGKEGLELQIELRWLVSWPWKGGDNLDWQRRPNESQGSLQVNEEGRSIQKREMGTEAEVGIMWAMRQERG